MAHVNVQVFLKLVKANNITILTGVPIVEVPKKEVLKHKQVYTFKDRPVAISSDAILVHLEKDALPRILHSEALVLDFNSEAQVIMSFRDLMRFALVNSFDV